MCLLLLFLDLLVAFYMMVYHAKLLQLLSDIIDLKGITLKWFQRYLPETIQSVVIDGIESELWRILFGVSQGLRWVQFFLLFTHHP